MSEPINYPMIERNGKPEYAVVPYATFQLLFNRLEAGDDTWIPHKLVEDHMINGYSVLKARLHLT